MSRYTLILLTAFLLPLQLCAKVVVFLQPGFPTIASHEMDRASILKALDGMNAVVTDVEGLKAPDALSDAELLVLPYGSALPVDAWTGIQHYLDTGGNLLVLGGQPLRVPVKLIGGKFVAGRAQDTYARVVGFRHTYEIPVAADATFQWKQGDSWRPAIAVRARKFFAVEGRLDGLGYMADATGQLVAAPVIVANHAGGGGRGNRTPDKRIVALDFDPVAGYWRSSDGIALVRQAAEYARQGPTDFSVEILYSALPPGETPQVSIHLRSARQQRLATSVSGEVKLQITSDKQAVESVTVPVTNNGSVDREAPFHQKLAAGFYKIAAIYSEAGQPEESYQNGFWVKDAGSLASGPILGVRGDFLSLDARPFLPVGANYFSTESNGWDFSGPRNAWIWDRDFAEMSAHGVTFVRTGVWMANGKFIEAATGGANERFLRNLEAFLLCAQHHNIAVNFTFFAFSPQSGSFARPTGPIAAAPTRPGAPDTGPIAPNPYTDPETLRAQQSYVRSVVERFKSVPWLSWDLINEPSYSNPRHIWKGNYPNADPTEVAAWHKWLSEKYVDLSMLGDAWSVPGPGLVSFDQIPLPAPADLDYGRIGSPNQIRALDYNLFAQDMFSGWVKSMVSAIRSSGSSQLVNVGQDEGGVTNRVLNQFYGGAGVSFTTNHTYWQDDSLLWDSLVAKRPGVPNIIGETGYQPAWGPDGSWRYDEMTGLGLTERKWALGFAAGSSGVMQWDWDREVDFGMLRSDGSAKLWENMMRNLGRFATQAAPFATSLTAPEVAIVLPQSYQLSVSNGLALDAQQKAARALYYYAHAQAYAVGEYQPELLGSPRLILLPSPFGLTDAAWQAIEQRVRAGAVLLVTGPFGEDAHFHTTARQDSVGLPYTTGPLTLRENVLEFPGGQATLSYSGLKTTLLNRAILPNGEGWMEKPLGKGRILFAALPLELNDNLQVLGDVYSYALKVAKIASVYSTAMKDTGMLICPTVFPQATLYVLTSESSQHDVSFQDKRSGKAFAGTLESGRAALLLVGTDGKLLANYNWKAK